VAFLNPRASEVEGPGRPFYLNTITNHRKKKERLAKKERELQRLIERGASREKLLQAALEVRDGRIRVLRALQNQNPERNAKDRAIFLKHTDQIKVLLDLTAEMVLDEYVNQKPACQKPMQTTA
jgi:hypothetical protein